MFLSKRTEFDEVVLFAVLQSGSGGSVPYLVMKFSKAEPEISLVGADTNGLRREWEERSRAKSWGGGGGCSWAPRLHPTKLLWEPSRELHTTAPWTEQELSSHLPDLCSLCLKVTLRFSSA